MSTPPASAQKTCNNIWHRNPGALLKCPHCNMTLSELSAARTATIASARQAVNGQRQAPQGVPPMRIALKYFENSEPEVAIREANEYAAKIVDDDRVKIVDASYGTRRVKPLAHEGHDVFYVVFVTNMVLG